MSRVALPTVAWRAFVAGREPVDVVRFDSDCVEVAADLRDALGRVLPLRIEGGDQVYLAQGLVQSVTIFGSRVSRLMLSGPMYEVAP